MSELQITFSRRVIPVLKRQAKRCFRKSFEKEELTCDALSLAWEFYLRKPTAPVIKLVDFALRHAIAGRQFRQKVKSLGGPKSLSCEKPPRDLDFNVAMVIEWGADPAEIAAFRLDFVAWVATLSHRDRAILKQAVLGDTTLLLAQKFDVSPGRISQIRRELVEDWLAFTEA